MENNDKITCECCLSEFENKVKYTTHKKLKYCTFYKDIIFNCKKCNFSTIGIKKINSHIATCDGIFKSSQEEDVSREEIKNLKNIILKIEHELEVEKIKNTIYTGIIEKNIKIKISEVVNEKEGEIHIYNNSNIKIPVIIYDNINMINTKHENNNNEEEQNLKTFQEKKVRFIDDEEKTEIKIEEKTEEKPEIKQEEKSEEKSEEKLEEVREIKQEEKPEDIELKNSKNYLFCSSIINEINSLYDNNNKICKTRVSISNIRFSKRKIGDHLNLTVEKTDEEINTIIKNVDDEKKSRTIKLTLLVKTMDRLDRMIDKIPIETINDNHNRCKHSLSSICELREGLLQMMPVEQYGKIVKQHLNNIRKIFNVQPLIGKFEREFIYDAFNYTDLRIIGHPVYDICSPYNGSNLYCKGLNFSAYHPQFYEPYDVSILKKFETHHGASLYIVDMLDFMKTYFINPYGFNNVIYLPLPESTNSDPFAFYTLQKVEVNEKRYWSQDCRLINLCYALQHEFLHKYIAHFRSVYKHIYFDNVYIPNFFGKIDDFLPVGVEALNCLYNIFLLNNPRELSKILTTCIKKYATYTPTENDSFNIYGDSKEDAIDPEELLSITVNTIRECFDFMSLEQATELYNNIKTDAYKRQREIDKYFIDSDDE